MLTKDEQKKKVKKEIWESFAYSIIFIVFGLVLLFKSENIIQNLVLAIALFGLVFGGMSLLMYFRLDEKLRAYSGDLEKGLLFILFSIVALIKTSVFVSVFTLMIGGYLVCKHVDRIQNALQIRNDKAGIWSTIIGISVICIFLGMLILLNPFDGKIPLSMVVAVCLMVSEGLGIIQNILFLVSMGKENEGKKE